MFDALSLFSRKSFTAFRIFQRVHFSNKMVSDSSVECLKIKKLTKAAIKPTRGSGKAAGYDLYAAHEAVIHARGKSLIKTDLAVQIPKGYYGRVAPRSGLTWKHSLDVGAGVIDEDYRGNVGVILFNHSDEPFNINRGDRIAQLILEKIITPEVVEVDELDQTERDADGFGSTGVSSTK